MGSLRGRLRRLGRPDEDARVLARLRAGDEDAFRELVERHGDGLLRLARLYVKSRAVAEEVVQETWLGVLKGLDRFEGRSSLKTWIFRICANLALTRARREARSVPFSALVRDDDDDGPTVDPSRFASGGAWADPPRAWAPEAELLAGEARRRIDEAIAELPERQRLVITLRDVEGWPAADVADLLQITENNQRVLLHRARARVRERLARYFELEPSA